MATINLIRVDQRMVHGQVAVKWSRAAKVTKIICVDDAVAANETTKKIYKLAAPTGTKVLVYSIDRCIEKWNECQFNDGTVMMLFKDVNTCYRLFEKGFEIKKLQLGNAPKTETNNLTLGNEFHVNADQLKLLRDMASKGVQIEVQTIPEQTAVSLEKAAANL